MAKRTPINSRAALSKAIRDAVVPAPSALRVKLGSSVYTVAGDDTFIGTLVGKDYGALVLGERTLYLFRIDHKSGGSTARMLNSAEPEEIEGMAADLLPEPEDPQEVKDAQAAASTLPKLPKGYAYAGDGKGGVVVIPTEVGAARLPGASAPREPKPASAPKPAVEVGVEVKRRVGKEAGRTYRITKIEPTGYAIFANVADANDDIREMVVAKNGKLPPAFWNRWEEVA